jgi:PAS domain-containing protein
MDLSNWSSSMADNKTVPGRTNNTRGPARSINAWLLGISENGTFAYCSAQCESLLGYTPEEVVGKAPWDFMYSAEGNRLKKNHF